MAPPTPPYALIAGVGPGTGASVARRFAASYRVILMARNAENYTPVVEEIEKGGGWARGIRVDVSDEGSVRGAFGEVGRVLGEGADGKEGGEGKEEGKKGKVAAAVFNVGGKFIRKGFLELAVGEFESGWEANGRGAFLFSQAVLPLLLNSTDLTHPPTLIFTGATASVKGSALCASFATGKFALRALAQSLGREFGPKGVHVAHAIIDGVIDIPKTKEWKFEEPDAKISADAIADAYWYLHTQPRTTFTHEIDIRPYVEKW